MQAFLSGITAKTPHSVPVFGTNFCYVHDNFNCVTSNALIDIGAFSGAISKNFSQNNQKLLYRENQCHSHYIFT